MFLSLIRADQAAFSNGPKQHCVSVILAGGAPGDATASLL
jgi:hypothetical protein